MASGPRFAAPRGRAGEQYAGDVRTRDRQTSETMPISTAKNAANGPVLPGSGDRATTRSPLPRFSRGIRAQLLTDRRKLSCAWRTLTPGLRRAPITNHTLSRLRRSDWSVAEVADHADRNPQVSRDH